MHQSRSRSHTINEKREILHKVIEEERKQLENLTPEFVSSLQKEILKLKGVIHKQQEFQDKLVVTAQSEIEKSKHQTRHSQCSPKMQQHMYEDMNKSNRSMIEHNSGYIGAIH
jgi:hypothetical protein